MARPKRINYPRNIEGEGLIARQLRHSAISWIEAEGSLNTLAVKMELPQPMLWRWLNNESRDLYVSTADRIAEFLEEAGYLDLSSLRT